VEQFERSIFCFPEWAKVGWSPGTASRLAEAPFDILSRLQRATFDSSIFDLPLGHCFMEALAALIADASLQIEEFSEFLERFSKLWVICSSPSGQARIGGALYLPPAPPEKDRFSSGRGDRAQLQYFVSGIHQERMVSGNAIMLLGTAFRENGPHYANAKEAYRARYGTTTQKRAKAGSRTGAR
jgi:hypothetical protein